MVGVLMSTRDQDVILVERGTSRLHQYLIALHEAAHAYLDHHGSPLSDELPGQQQIFEDNVRAMAELMPGLDPQLISSMLGRRYPYTSVSGDDSGSGADPSSAAGAQVEGAAELVASMILERAWRPAARAYPSRTGGRPASHLRGQVAAWPAALITVGVCLVIAIGTGAAGTAAGAVLDRSGIPGVQLPWWTAAGAGLAAATILAGLAAGLASRAAAGLTARLGPMLMSGPSSAWGRLRRLVQLHRMHRELSPLWSAMVEAVPAVRLSVVRQSPFACSSTAVSLRVIRQLTEISDARLILRQWCDYDLRARVSRQARSQGLPIGQARAAGEAAMLSAALHAYTAGEEPLNAPQASWTEEITHHRTLGTISTRTTLSEQFSEACDWYVAVSQAFGPGMSRPRSAALYVWPLGAGIIPAWVGVCA